MNPAAVWVTLGGVALAIGVNIYFFSPRRAVVAAVPPPPAPPADVVPEVPVAPDLLGGPPAEGA